MAPVPAETLRGYIGNSEIGKAIEALQDLANAVARPWTNRLYEEAQAYKKLEKDKRDGILDFRDGEIRRNTIVRNLLEIITELEEAGIFLGKVITDSKLPTNPTVTKEFHPPIFKPASGFMRFLYRTVPALDRKKSYLQCLEKSPKFTKPDLLDIFANYQFQQLEIHGISKYHNTLREIAPKVAWNKLLQEAPFKAFTQGFFLKEKTSVLLLADSGYGKTTFLQKLFYDYARTYPAVSLTFIYAGQTTAAQIRAIANPRETILFLDALDEDQEARRNLQDCIRHLSPLLQHFRQVVISARVQLFRNREEEWQHIHRLIPVGINALDPWSYLEHRLGKQSAEYKKAVELVQRHPEMFKRPLFLSWIEDLLYMSAERSLKYLSEMYKALADRWAEREEAKVEEQVFQARTYRYRLLGFSEELAVYIYRHQTEQLNPESIAQIAEKFGISSLDSRDRSFLTRDRASDTWIFTHQSFFDYFLARALLTGRLREEDFEFKAYPATTDLYNEMCWLRIAGQDKVMEHKGQPVYWNQDEHFADERITLQPNWVIRALSFAQLNKLPKSMVYWQDLLHNLRPFEQDLQQCLLPYGEDRLSSNLPPAVQHQHYVWQDYAAFLAVLQDGKPAETTGSLYFEQLLREARFQYLLQLCGQKNWQAQAILHLNITPAQQAAWPTYLPAPASLADSLSGLLQNNPILRRSWGQLQQLRLSGFGLQVIPGALLDLKALSSLDLNNNQIQVDDPLLKKLLRLPELMELQLEGNPILQNWDGDSSLRALREHWLFPPEMVEVQGGRFKMGQPDSKILLYDDGHGNARYSDDEQPVHPVELSDFWMATHPVTVGEFRRFVRESGYQNLAEKEGWSWGYNRETDDWEKIEGLNWQHDPHGQLQHNDRHPVLYVCWYDAIEYCNWLSETTKLEPVYQLDYKRADPNNLSDDDTLKCSVQVNWAANGYRLPTEAEWEYAARERGQELRFGNGQDIADPAQMNFDARLQYQTQYSIAGVYRERTVPADAFAPNAQGLFNMSGNVFEWCWDWYYDQDYYQYSPLENPYGPEKGAYRVLRGGCWNSYAEHCRSSFRFNYPPATRRNSFGFRVVLFPPPGRRPAHSNSP